MGKFNSCLIGILFGLAFLFVFKIDMCSANNIAVSEVEISDESNDVKRFIRIADQDDFYIVYDTLTKVQYAVSSGGYNMGTLNLLVDRAGHPLLYEE